MKFRDLPEKLENKKTKLQRVLDDFLDLGLSQVEVVADEDEYQSIHSLYSSLFGGARKWADGKVRVVMQNQRVYLVREDF